MNRNARIFSFLVLALAALGSCSSQPAANSAKKAAAPDRIEGKAQLLEEGGGAIDAALNAGGSSSVYLWVGVQRYRLFLRTPVEVVHGKQYVAEGLYAQNAIDAMGDPDQGKHGYPLQASCEQAVSKIWPNLAFDEIGLDATALRTTVQRHPAKQTPADEENIPEITVAPEKQRALLVEGQTTQPAPLWQADGGTVHCKIVLDTAGTVTEIETGTQLCEAVPWSTFKYQPTVEKGHPVRVETDVEVKFEPKK